MIAELIYIKVLANRVSNVCVADLLTYFFKEHYGTPRNPDMAEIFFESAILMVDKVGKKFETGEKSSSSFGACNKEINKAIRN